MVGTANAQTTTNNYKVAGNANTVFTDVPKDHWSKDAIDYLAAAGLLTDMEMDNLVLHHITRGQVTSLIARHLGLTANNEQSNMFNDIKNHMFEKDIKAIVQAGIMTGDGTGAFRPDDALTRYEMAVVLQKHFNYNQMDKVPLKMYLKIIGPINL